MAVKNFFQMSAENSVSDGGDGDKFSPWANALGEVVLVVLGLLVASAFAATLIKYVLWLFSDDRCSVCLGLRQ